ncbi:MAG: hypothetical protein AAF591_04505 [Verrucomicrobiota bacterium]
MAIEEDPASRTGAGTTLALTFSILVNLILIAGAYFLYKAKTEADAQVASTIAQMKTLEENHVEKIAELEANFSDEMRKSDAEWNQRLADAEAAHQRLLSGIYGQVNKIMYESDETLKYIDTLEGKLRSGQTLAKEEIDTLQMIGSGLGYLQEQYEKPIGEFRELEQFLASKLDVPPLPPKEKGKFLARIFSKKFREEEKEYYRDVGRWEAFESARNEVTAAYGRAQQQMSQVGLNTDKYLADLQNLIAAKEANAEQLTDFFDSSRKVLNIHQEIMKLQDFQPPADSTIPVQP